MLIAGRHFGYGLNGVVRLGPRRPPRFVVAIHLEGSEFGVKGGFPLPPSLHTFDANNFGVIADDDVPVQDEGLVAGECVGQLLHV